MAKRNKETTRATRGMTTADVMEQRVMAFADQLGRIAGTFHAKAEGWLDRDALTKQIASVRDGASALLEHLAGGPKSRSKTRPVATAALGQTKGRSGGVVDAPGKKHRKPLPTGPGANVAGSQASKMRMARTMVKTNRHRGRG